jgi:hypothetical protein
LYYGKYLNELIVYVSDLPYKIFQTNTIRSEDTIERRKIAIYGFLVRSEGLAAVTMKVYVFWVIEPCNLVNTFPRFRRNLLPQSSGQKLFKM